MHIVFFVCRDIIYTKLTQVDLDRVKGIAVNKYLKSSWSGYSIDDLWHHGIIAYLSRVYRYNALDNNFYWGFAYLRVWGVMEDLVRSRAKELQKVKYFDSSPIDNTKTEDLVQSLLFRERYEVSIKDLDPLTKKVLTSYLFENLDAFHLGGLYKLPKRKIIKILENGFDVIKDVFEKEGYGVTKGSYQIK